MARRIGTALAAQIARLDRQRLNEAIAAGFLPCFPETRPGVTRAFGEKDVMALIIYARLLGLGVPPSKAGPFACQARDHIDDNTEELRFTVARGEADFFTGERPAGAKFIGPYPIEMTITFDVGNYRTIITKHVDEAEASRIVDIDPIVDVDE